MNLEQTTNINIMGSFSQLKQKLTQEYEEYMNSIAVMSKEDILKNIDKISAMKDVHKHLTSEYMDYHDHEVEFFLSSEKPLDFVASHWLNHWKSNGTEINNTLATFIHPTGIKTKEKGCEKNLPDIDTNVAEVGSNQTSSNNIMTAYKMEATRIIDEEKNGRGRVPTSKSPRRYLPKGMNDIKSTRRLTD